MSNENTNPLGTSRLVDEFVNRLDWLESGLRKGAERIGFLAHRCPDLILHAPMKPGVYIRGISELQEYARTRSPVPDLKAQVHADPEIISVLQEWAEFVGQRPQVEAQLKSMAREIAGRIAASTWGGDTAVDCLLDLEPLLNNRIADEILYSAMSAARKQARRFQVFSGEPTVQLGEASQQRPVPVCPSAELDSGKEYQRPRTHVFVSYSHADTDWLKRLQVHLKPMVRNGSVLPWDDTMIKPGTKWRDEIKKALASAKVAVLLVSPDFLASDFIANHELPPLLNAAEKEGLTILWIPIRHSSYTELPDLASYQAAHAPDHPLASLSPHDQDKALVAICQTIKSAVAKP